MKTDIGKRMKIRRIELGLKVQALANELGVAQSTYREWEHGRKIQGEPYLEISRALQIPLSQLLGLDSVNLNELNENLRHLEKSVKILRNSFLKIL